MNYQIQHLTVHEKFKKWNGKDKIDDLESYIYQILNNDKFTKIAIGTDSKFRSKKIKDKLFHYVNYFTVISFTYGNRGTHLIFRKEVMKGEGKISLFSRLWREVTLSADLALWMHEKCNIIPCIHLDINPDERFESNMLYKSAEGFIKYELGFPVEVKPNAATASRAADHLCKFSTNKKRDLTQHCNSQKVNMIN